MTGPFIFLGQVAPQHPYQLGIDWETVWQILRKKLKLYPYKQHAVLDLSDRKKEGRVEFCTLVLEQLTNDPDKIKFEERTQP